MDRPAATAAANYGARSGRALLVGADVGDLLVAPSSAHVQAAPCSACPELLWPSNSPDAFVADLATSPRPEPSREWAKAVDQLVALSRAPALAPAWWTPATGLFGGIETRTDPTSYDWDRLKLQAPKDAPVLYFQLTFAGCGQYQLDGDKPQRLTAGKALFVLVPSRHQYCLPQESSGWTFGWIGISHPYLVSRVAKLVALSGPLFDISPEGGLSASVFRLMRGAIAKDFRDQFDLELALFDFVLACERRSHEVRDVSGGAGQQLLDEVQSRIVASLPKAMGVETLAATYGMSRSHFSHFFRSRTGLTPAHFATEVRIQEATRMLLDSRLPLKSIADACGFANANHFCKVFRRFQHLSPGAYRQAMQ